MRLLESYLLKRVLIVFAATLLATIGVTWIVQLLSRINFLTTSGQNFLGLLQFSSLFIPPLIPFVMPFALVIAVTMVLGAFHRDSELVVIAAAGARRRTIWRPLITLGVLVALVSFLITNFVAPYARLSMREQLATAHADLINLLLQEGNFRQVAQDIYIEIGERREDGTIGKLFIVDESNPQMDIHYYAIDGRVAKSGTSHFLILQRGEIQRIDKQRGEISIIQFDSYTFDLSSFAPAARTMTILPKDQFLADLLFPDPNDSYYQRRPLHYLAELHQRLSGWLFPIVFVLIALVANGNAHSHRQSNSFAIIAPLVMSLLLYWLEQVMIDWSENDPAFLPLLYLIPLAALISALVMLGRGTNLALPTRWEELLSLMVEKFKKNRVRQEESG